MDKNAVARDVLDALGGRKNVLSNAVCMTRLRVTLADAQIVDYEALGDVEGVLGTAMRGSNGLEVVFGPRVIDGIYRAFRELTGISGGIGDLFPMSRQQSNISVQIRTRKKERPQAASGQDAPLLDEHEMSVLEDLFGRKDEEEQPAGGSGLRLMVVNGPNINMLGLPGQDAGEPEEGADDFPALLELCKKTAREAGFARCDCFQSNHEGDLIDLVQDAFEAYDAILVNPGTYGSSGALRDALRAVSVPAMEVHRHKLGRRDAVGTACLGMVSGLGTEGYAKAIRDLARHLGSKGPTAGGKGETSFSTTR